MATTPREYDIYPPGYGHAMHRVEAADAEAAVQLGRYLLYPSLQRAHGGTLPWTGWTAREVVAEMPALVPITVEVTLPSAPEFAEAMARVWPEAAE